MIDSNRRPGGKLAQARFVLAQLLLQLFARPDFSFQFPAIFFKLEVGGGQSLHLLHQFFRDQPRMLLGESCWINSLNRARLLERFLYGLQDYLGIGGLIDTPGQAQGFQQLLRLGLMVGGRVQDHGNARRRGFGA